VYRARNANSGGFGNLLQARSDVYAITQKVIIFGYNVAKVNAEAKLHPLCLGQIDIVAVKRSLDRDSRTHGLNRACELRDHAVTGSTKNPTGVLGDQT